jgi:hypothetical protein
MVIQQLAVPVVVVALIQAVAAVEQDTNGEVVGIPR